MWVKSQELCQFYHVMAVTSCHLTTKNHHRGRGVGGGEYLGRYSKLTARGARGSWVHLSKSVNPLYNVRVLSIKLHLSIAH